MRALELFFIKIGAFGYLVSFLLYLGLLTFKKEALGRIASHSLLVAFVLHSASLVFRGLSAGRLPILSFYEFMVVFAWGTAAIYLLVERSTRRRGMGAFVLAVVLGLMAYGLALPSQIEPVIPILRGAWVQVHVITSLIAYPTFAVSFGTAIVFLLADRSRRSDGALRLLPDPKTLDLLTHRVIAFGFTFLTLSIIAGAIWAESTWGRFWGWDPKETWSLITWLTYAAYLHTRFSLGWHGRKAAVLGIVGFALVLMTYIGVDYFNPRQHDFLLWQRR